MPRTFSFVIWLALGAVGSGQTTGFINRTHKSADGVETKYVIFVPHDYRKGSNPPAMLFLHGAGETGTDGLRQSQVGLGKAIRAREKNFPFVVVFPQAQKREKDLIDTWYPAKTEGKRALAMLEDAIKEFGCDTKRVYLTGLSMGGFGTWAMAQTYPKKWAAIAPICGGGDPKWAGDIKDIPCWCFHGDKDPTVPPYRSRQMIEALKAAGAEPKYDEFAGVGHNSWDKAYDNDPLYKWFLSHKTK